MRSLNVQLRARLDGDWTATRLALQECPGDVLRDLRAIFCRDEDIGHILKRLPEENLDLIGHLAGIAFFEASLLVAEHLADALADEEGGRS